MISIKPILRRSVEAKFQKQFFKSTICQKELIGLCSRGKYCKFAHSDLEIRTRPCLDKTRMCLKPKCVDSSCKFAHSREELKATPNFAKTKMCHFGEKCMNGDTCRYAHRVSEIIGPKPLSMPISLMTESTAQSDFVETTTTIYPTYDADMEGRPEVSLSQELNLDPLHLVSAPLSLGAEADSEQIPFSDWHRRSESSDGDTEETEDGFMKYNDCRTPSRGSSLYGSPSPFASPVSSCISPMRGFGSIPHDPVSPVSPGRTMLNFGSRLLGPLFSNFNGMEQQYAPVTDSDPQSPGVSLFSSGVSPRAAAMRALLEITGGSYPTLDANGGMNSH